jgi:hypothetical protein
METGDRKTRMVEESHPTQVFHWRQAEMLGLLPFKEAGLSNLETS